MLILMDSEQSRAVTYELPRVDRYARRYAK